MNQERVDIKTPEFVSLQFQPAALGSRAAALIIDQAIILLINLIVFLILFFIEMGQPSLFANMSSVALALFIILIFLLNWGYFFAFEFFNGGRTIGKKAMGIRVIQENGHSLTLLSSFIRNLLRIIDSLPSSYLLGMIMVFFHSQHKRLGDVVAGTIVVHERKAKKSGKVMPIEKEIASRGITEHDFVVDAWTLKTFTQKDWQLIKTYCHRYLQLPAVEQKQLTKQVSIILLPKMGIESESLSITELENYLFSLYLVLKQEWEYEL